MHKERIKVMPNGTTLNGVFAPRIHKSNAKVVCEESEESIRHCREMLVMLAAATPEYEEIHRIPEVVGELVDAVQESAFSMFCASYIIECPDECEDELKKS